MSVENIEPRSEWHKRQLPRLEARFAERQSRARQLGVRVDQLTVDGEINWGPRALIIQERLPPGKVYSLEEIEAAFPFTPPDNDDEADAPRTAVDFLARFLGDEPWPLVAIRNGAVKAYTLPASAKREAAATKWISYHNQKSANLYFSPNPLRRLIHKKAEKGDVAGAAWLWADLDPPKDATDAEIEAWRGERREELDGALPDGFPQPSWIIDSGRGFWLFWRLREPFPVDGKDGPLTQAVEAYGAAIEQAFAPWTDSCRNVDRIARLPFTVNHKTGKLAAVVRDNHEAAYTLADFPQPSRKAAPALAPAPATELPKADLSDLPEKLVRLIRDGAPVTQRSAKFHRVVLSLNSLGKSAAQIEALLASHPTGIAEKYTGRLAQEIARCLSKAPAPPDQPRPDGPEERSLPPAVDLDSLDIEVLGKTMAARVVETIRDGRYEDFKGGDRWRAVFFVACQLLRAGIAPSIVLAILLDPALKISEHCRAQNNPQREAEGKIADADEAVVPLIKVIAGRNDRASNAAEAALKRAGTPIYDRGFRLVAPLWREVPAADDRTTSTAVLDALDFYALNDRITSASEFRRFDARMKDGGDWKTIDPPPLVGKTILSRKGRGFPSVIGISTAPLLHSDGSITDQPGYDKASRLYLALDARSRLPALKASPTLEDAVEALKALEDLLIEFPFVSDIDRSVALSMLMTTLLRASLNVAPFHLTRSHMSGTGKSYLVDIASVIATGRWAPVIDMNRDKDEVSKRLEAVLLNGQPIVSLDNLEGEIGGPALCLFTERPLIELRILGTSEIPEVESRAMCLGTGNNVTPTKDIVRRTLVADLDAVEENPERHAFNADPLHTVAQDRGRYIAAIMTIARAYILARYPKVEIAPLASYAQWTRLVRAPLVWLGKPDPVASMDKIRIEDPERIDMAELFAMVERIFGLEKPFKARDLANVAEGKIPDLVDEAEKKDEAVLRDLLMRITDSRGVISTKRLGKWLTGRQGQIVGERRIVRYGGDVHSHGQRFMLTAIGK